LIDRHFFSVLGDLNVRLGWLRLLLCLKRRNNHFLLLRWLNLLLPNQWHWFDSSSRVIVMEDVVPVIKVDDDLNLILHISLTGSSPVKILLAKETLVLLYVAYTNR
jgi:hypothetical protein